jgi:hypothetical protein
MGRDGSAGDRLWRHRAGRARDGDRGDHIQPGLRELASTETLPATRTRKAGGGRKRVTDLDPTLLRDLDALVEPTAPGDPDSPLRWTCLSARTLAVALERLGHHIQNRSPAAD